MAMEFNHNFQKNGASHILEDMTCTGSFMKKWNFDMVQNTFASVQFVLGNRLSSKCKLAQTGTERRRRIVKFRFCFLEGGTVLGDKQRWTIEGRELRLTHKEFCGL